MHLHVLIVASHLQEKSPGYEEVRCTAKPGWALQVLLHNCQSFVKMTQWQMKVVAHQPESYETLLLCFTSVHSNTHSTAYTQMSRSAMKDGDDTYNQPETVQSRSSSVILVFYLSLSQHHVLRLERVNQAKRIRAERPGRGEPVRPFREDKLKRSPGLIRLIATTSWRVLLWLKQGSGRCFLL